MDSRTQFILTLVLCTIHLAGGIDYIAPGIEGHPSNLMECSDGPIVGWMLPNRKMIQRGNRDLKYELYSNNSFRVADLRKEDLGQYDCVSRNNSGALHYGKSYVLPYVITKKNYLRSFGIALGVTLGFITLAVLLAFVIEKSRRTREKHNSTKVAPQVVNYNKAPSPTFIVLDAGETSRAGSRAMSRDNQSFELGSGQSLDRSTDIGVNVSRASIDTPI